MVFLLDAQNSPTLEGHLGMVHLTINLTTILVSSSLPFTQISVLLQRNYR